MSEGVLVVADAGKPPLSSEVEVLVPPLPAVLPDQPQVSSLVVQGVLGWLQFDGRWVLIGKNGVGHIYKGERRYHISRLSGVALKAATRLPLAWFDELAIHQFDVVRWLVPWRQRWRHLTSQPQSPTT